MSDQVKIDLPKGSVESIVRAHIQGEVAKALSRDPADLVRKVVEAAMHEKSSHSYGRQSVFEEQVSKMIRDTAADEFKAWLDEMRPAIAKQIRARFDGSSKKLVDQIAEKLTGHLGGMFDVRVDIRDMGQ